MFPDSALIYELVRKVPALESQLREHLTDNKTLLPHVFMGDVSRFAIDQIKMAGRTDVQILLDYFEEVLEGGTPTEKELIIASFIENLIEEDGALRILRLMMKPRMQEALSKMSSQNF